MSALDVTATHDVDSPSCLYGVVGVHLDATCSLAQLLQAAASLVLPNAGLDADDTIFHVQIQLPLPVATPVALQPLSCSVLLLQLAALHIALPVPLYPDCCLQMTVQYIH